MLKKFSKNAVFALGIDPIWINKKYKSFLESMSMNTNLIDGQSLFSKLKKDQNLQILELKIMRLKDTR